MLSYLSRRQMQEVELSPAEIGPAVTPPGSLLERSEASVSNMLDRFRGDALRLEQEIAEASEKLRQTRVAIAAFEAAGKVIEEGKKPRQEAA